MAEESNQSYSLEAPPQAPHQSWPAAGEISNTAIKRVWPPQPAPADLFAAPQEVPPEARCVVCGYMLRGLATGGRCPECGTSVLRSIQGNLLKFSSAAYLAALHRGVFIILAAIVMQIVLFVVMIVGAFPLLRMAGSLTQNARVAQIFLYGAQLASIAASLAVVYGWWLFSTPDPAILGVNTGATARHVVRVTLVINAVTTIANSLLELALPPTPQMQIVLVAAAIVGLIAWVVQFFASMCYVQWLAPRLPDMRVHKRARLLMWLGPLLYTVGALACGIGPLVALVLYWNMLNWVRIDIKALRAAQSDPEFA
jgi:hypothetical protein